MLQKARVPLGFLFGAIFVIFARPTLACLMVGSAVAVLGLALRLWAAGCLRKHKELCLTGPYRLTRNPLYLGSFVMGIGFCIASAQLWLLAFFLILFALVYAPVIHREQAELRNAYGESYGDYVEQVPKFFPSLTARVVETQESGTFSWRQVLYNREYNAVLGFLAVTVILLIKVLYRL